MGMQSACFSPLKYAILPQQLSAAELVPANSLLHMGTSTAILVGLIGGSAVAQLPGGTQVVAVIGVVIAVLGYLSSRFIPAAPSAAPELILRYNPLRQYWRSFNYARENRLVFTVIIAISWYWFVGSIFLTQLPNLIRANLGAGPLAVPVFLLLFLTGIGIGTVLSSKLSRRRVEAGLVPVGGGLISVAGFYLYWATESYVQQYGLGAQASTALVGVAELVGVTELLSRPLAVHVLLGFVLLGVVGSLYVVPLLSLLQERTRAETRAQVVGATNFINATFMIIAALAGAFFLAKLNFSIAELFLLTALLNLVVLLWLVWVEAEFWQRFIQRFWVSQPDLNDDVTDVNDKHEDLC